MAPPKPRPKKSQPSEYQTIAAQFAAAKRAAQGKEGLQRAAASASAVSAALGSAAPVSTAAPSAMEQHRLARESLCKSAYERRWLWTIGFWLWLLAIHAAGILYFTSGFLLTRLVLDEQSSCSASPLGTVDSLASSSPDGCWHPKTFDRAVVILIDALRYDFTVPVNDSEAFHNAFPFLYETAAAQPTHAFLRPFLADPPTTTLQRLKGLTTGTLPTFIDMGSNFAGTAIEEDSLLAQLRAAGKKMVHLGDDTWTALFPDYFEANISHAYDSFNVWDLHTVDNGVIDHIFPLLEGHKAQEDGQDQWDVLIGHCLGVDHAGHRYGPAHVAMQEKLQQMDAFVRRVAASIDDDTLLVVMGDHGMDSKGDHGGESDDEVEAALWMYARRPLFGRTQPQFSTPPATAKDRPVHQIDLVPTLALLLGVPIPYNNLGWPIEEAFIGSAGNDWANLARAAQVTAAGIHRYQTSYFQARSSELGSSSSRHARTPPMAPILSGGTVKGAQKQQAMADAYVALSQYQEETLRICKDLWARFDVQSMVVGILISAAGVGVLLLYASRDSRGGSDNNENDDEDVAIMEDPMLDHAEMLLELQGELVGTSATASSVSPSPSPAQNKEDSEESRVLRQQQQLHRSLVLAAGMAAAFGLAAGAALSSLASMTRSQSNKQPWWYWGAALAALASTAAVTGQLVGMGRRRLARLVPNTVWGWLSVVFVVAQSVGFASNSYTIWEDAILLFFLATFGLVAAMQALRLQRPAERALGVYHAAVFVVLGRVASLSKLCREEQMPYCTSTYYASASSSTSAPWQLAIPFAVFLVLPAIVRSFYTPTRSYESLAPVWIGGVLRGGLLLAAVYWTLDAADNGDWFGGGSATKTASVYLAQTVLGLALVAGTVAFVWAGPCVSVTAVSRPGSNKAQVAVLGYANAHGARYLLLPVNLIIAAVLLSKPMGGGAMALMLWQVLSLLELLDLLRAGGEPEEKLDNMMQMGEEVDTTTRPLRISSPTVIGPIILAMLANLHYFTTGHQAVLSSIQWDSAFIPLFTIRYPWSPLVVVGNTFPGHLLAVAAVPLLVLWKRGPRRRGGLLSPTSRALAGFAAYFAVEALATMAWAGHLRRHLMLYRVFNPRFMLAAAVLLVVDVAGILIALPGLRSNTLAVSEVFGWLEDY